LCVAATRDIAIGEQFFITYVDAEAPYEERQHALAAHAFKCRWRRCISKI
jgi:hypothetical protein